MSSFSGSKTPIVPHKNVHARTHALQGIFHISSFSCSQRSTSVFSECLLVMDLHQWRKSGKWKENWKCHQWKYFEPEVISIPASTLVLLAIVSLFFFCMFSYLRLILVYIWYSCFHASVAAQKYNMTTAVVKCTFTVY